MAAIPMTAMVARLPISDKFGRVTQTCVTHYITKIAKVQEVPDVPEVAADERVDGVEGDGEEGDGEGEAELDVLAGGRRHAQELVGAARAGVARVPRVRGVAGVPLHHVRVRALILGAHGVAQAARQQVGEELKHVTREQGGAQSTYCYPVIPRHPSCRTESAS